MSKALVVFSGGQDSTTCLYSALSVHDEVHAVTFDYGQRHAREIQAADLIAKYAKIEQPKINQVITHETIHLGSTILKSTSPLISDNDLEQYADHQSLPGGIEKTFVPLRNMMFLTLAANRAVDLGCTHIYTGVCQEDYGGYPDCREVFITNLQQTINLSNEGSAAPIEIVTPLMNLTKAETVNMAVHLDGCYGALAYSHTAYDGEYPPIGKDHATLLRAKGFEQAGVPDPLILRAALSDLMPMPNSPNYTEELVEYYAGIMYTQVQAQGFFKEDA